MKNENDVLGEIDQNAARAVKENLVGEAAPDPAIVAAAPLRGQPVLAAYPDDAPAIIPGRSSTLGRLISRLDKPVTIWVIDGFGRVQMRISPRSNQEMDGALIPDPLPTGINFVPYHRSV